MDAWRERFAAAREQILEDDEDDEFVLQQALGNLQDALDLDPPPKRRAGGSLPGKSGNIDRDRVEMDQRMFKDYFSESPVYGPASFRRRYRMRRSLLVMIMERVCACDSYFIQKRDAVGKIGLSSAQKITAALRMLADCNAMVLVASA